MNKTVITFVCACLSLIAAGVCGDLGLKGTTLSLIVLSIVLVCTAGALAENNC